MAAMFPGMNDGVIEMYDDDREGEISFYLWPSPELLDALPKDVSERARASDNEDTVEFYAVVDCRSMKVEFPVIKHFANEDGEIETTNMDLSPSLELREEVMNIIDKWCEKHRGASLWETADEKLKADGIGLAVKDCMERLNKNAWFGEPVYAARKLYADGAVLGDGLVIKFGKHLPDFLARASEFLKDSSITKVEIMAIDAKPIEFGSGFRNLLDRIENAEGEYARIGKKLGETLFSKSFDDIARSYVDVYLKTAHGNISVDIAGKDCDDADHAYLGLGQMRDIVKQKAPKAGKTASPKA